MKTAVCIAVHAVGVLAGREEVRAMLVLFGVLAVIVIVLGFIGVMAVYFSDGIMAYLEAKTDELHAMTDLINMAKEKDTHGDA